MFDRDLQSSGLLMTVSVSGRSLAAPAAVGDAVLASGIALFVSAPVDAVRDGAVDVSAEYVCTVAAVVSAAVDMSLGDTVPGPVSELTLVPVPVPMPVSMPVLVSVFVAVVAPGPWVFVYVYVAAPGPVEATVLALSAESIESAESVVSAVSVVIAATLTVRTSSGGVAVSVFLTLTLTLTLVGWLPGPLSLSLSLFRV